MTPLMHVPWEGGSDLFNGMAHPLVEVAHGLAMVSTGLWAGQRSAGASRGLLAGIFSGALAGMAIPPMGSLANEAILISVGLSGAATAIRLRIPEQGMILWGAWTSLCILNQTKGEGGETLLAPCGTTLSLLMIALLCSAFSRRVNGGFAWQTTAIQVAGSWLAAIAVLMLALKA